jgi:uroporphyrinogen-III decarboxylase
MGGPEAGHLFLINYTPDALDRPLPWPQLKSQRIEYAWEYYCHQRERAAWLRDDTIPYLNVYTGTEIFAEAFGCEVYRPKNDMPCARPLIYKSSEMSKLRVPKLEDPPLAMLFEIADELRRRGGVEATLKIVDLQSPMDTAALIWNKTDFFAAMYEDCEAVRALAALVADVMVAFLDLWFGRYGPDFVAHYPDYYMPKGVTLSEDDVGVVSATAFRNYYLPELEMLSERYRGLGLHCCADAVHQWDNFASIKGLRVLNLVQSETTLRAAYQRFSRTAVQYHSWSGDGPVWQHLQAMPEGSRVVLEAGAASREEALMVSDKLWQACGRS